MLPRREQCLLVSLSSVTMSHSATLSLLPCFSRLFKHKLVIVRVIQIRVALVRTGRQIIL